MSPYGAGYIASAPRKADFPISHRPRHPSIQVEHIPLEGLVLPKRFFVPVADEAFTLE